MFLPRHLPRRAPLPGRSASEEAETEEKPAEKETQESHSEKVEVEMSRSGYVDDCENLELYRATVERSIKGKRGQAFLRELAAAMDAMPEKVLIAEELVITI